MTNIEAVLTGVSHVFYLSGNSKSFMIEVAVLEEKSQSLGKSSIIVRLNGLHKSLKIFQCLPIGDTIGKTYLFKNVKAGSLKIPSINEKTYIYEAKSDCVVEETKNLKLKEMLSSFRKPELTRLSCYSGGIVTDDTFASDGIYILDQKITLVITHMAVISNVRLMSRGQRVELFDCHMDKIDQKHVFYPCSRGLVQTLEAGEELLSIHCPDSIESFKASPVVQACLQFNMTVDQVLIFHKIMSILKEKFGVAFVASLGKYFSAKENLKLFVDALKIDSLIYHNEPRSMIFEYFAKPHKCPLRNKSHVPRDAVNLRINYPSISNLVIRATELCHKIMDQKKERYKTADSNPRYDCCFQESRKVFSQETFLGQIVICRQTGRFLLVDETGAIPMTFLSDKEQIDLDHLVGQCVKLDQFWIVYESSAMGKEPWSLLYLVCSLKFLSRIGPSMRKVETGAKLNPAKCWRVLYSSGPIFSKEQGASTFCALREQSENNSQPLFARIFSHKRSCIHPGSILSCTSNGYIQEKSSLHLSYHLKRLDRINFQKPVYLPLLDFDVKPGPTNPQLDFKLDEIEEIPINELVNILGTISERWLERQHINISGLDIAEENSPLTSNSIQLKLQDPRIGSQGTISLFITHWSSHPYPLGLLPHATLRICNVVKVKSKKGHSYFSSSLFTTFQILNIEQPDSMVDHFYGMDELVELRRTREEDVVEDGSLHFINSLINPERGKIDVADAVFRFVVTLEKIFKVSITARCMFCGNQLCNKRCVFSGCHFDDPSKATYEARCSALVEDETQSAFVNFQGCQTIQDLLSLSQTEWNSLLEVSAVKGELLYLPNKGKRSSLERLVGREDTFDLTEHLFQCYCDSFPQIMYTKFKMTCRLLPTLPSEKSSYDCRIPKLQGLSIELV